MDKGTRQVKDWQVWRNDIHAMLQTVGMEIKETDTIISNIHTVSKDINLAEFMHKIGGVYRE